MLHPESMFISAADNIPLHLTRLNAGPPVLLLSGGPGCDPYLQPIADLMPDFESLVFSARGTGQSGGGAHELDTAIADLEAVRVGLGLERWRVLGHSWGADLGLAYALAHPERVSRLVSFAGTGIQHDRDWKAAYDAGKATELALDVPYNPEVHRALLTDWWRWIKLPDLLLRLSRLSVPTTFLHPGADIRPGWPAAQLAALIPDAKFHGLPGAPHNAWLTHAPELERVLREILKS